MLTKKSPSVHLRMCKQTLPIIKVQDQSDNYKERLGGCCKSSKSEKRENQESNTLTLSLLEIESLRHWSISSLNWVNKLQMHQATHHKGHRGE